MEWSYYSSWNWIAAGISIAFVAVTWHTLRAASGVPFGRRLLWLILRGALLVILLGILLNPHRVERKEFREPSDIAVLLDDSESMSLQDSPTSQPRLGQIKAEVTAMKSVLTHGGVNLRCYQFADDAKPVSGPEVLTATGKNSRIGKALETVLGDERARELGAAILVSDGQTLDPEAARNIARMYKQAKIPLYTRLIGTPEEAADLSLTDLTGCQDSLYKKDLCIKGTLHAPGFSERNVSLRVSCEDRVVYESIEAIKSEANPFSFVFNTPFTGFHHYRVEIQPEAGERLVTNNSGIIGVEVLERKIRLMYMEGTPNTTHFLENALESDPDIEVTSLFFPQTTSFKAARAIPFTVDEDGRKIYNVTHPIKGYPRTLTDMLNYDVIINSDIYKEAFTPDQLDLTVDFVEKYGGGFVMVGGNTAFGAGNYDKTVIDKLMPVDVYGNEVTSHGYFQLTVPDEMLSHPVMALGATGEETAQIWRETFPGFGGLNVVNRAKPGARVLASNANKSNDYGPLVVFAVQQIGSGRTMAFTSDTTKVWGTDFQDSFGTSADRTLYYRRFWKQTVRWLAADRIRRKSGELKVNMSRNLAVPGDSVDVRIPFSPDYPNAVVTLKHGLPGEKMSVLPLIRDELNRTWHAEVPLAKIGEWVFTAGMSRPGLDPLFVSSLVNVVLDDRERSSTAANRDLMSELAQIGGGKVLGDDPNTWPIKVDPRGSRIIEYGQRPSWDRWWLLGILLALLTLEWGLRRRWISGRTV
jgi:uncharacterized membrane protein